MLFGIKTYVLIITFDTIEKTTIKLQNLFLKYSSRYLTVVVAMIETGEGWNEAATHHHRVGNMSRHTHSHLHYCNYPFIEKKKHYDIAFRL